MANRHSPKTPSNAFVIEDPEPSKGPAYMKRAYMKRKSRSPRDDI